jgi:ATP-binding cassette subfamily B protein
VALRRAPERAPQVERGDRPLVRFDALSLRYAAHAPAALRRCSEEIRAGDRVLLEGPSGGGKSTLAVVLAGLRAADEGAVWLRGEKSEDVPFDAWRARIVLVPQFHDNHILTESLLFNLLLGRRWPPTPADVDDATEVCNTLGLGPLVARMPQGLAQMVGDSGWTLSHGERSRVFLARSLLQERVELIILDESFAALDPETLRLVYQGVVASAPTLLVIAHP